MAKKAKIASRNNPSARGKAKEFKYSGKVIKPIKLIMETSTFFGAEYEDGKLVLDQQGKPMPWAYARG